MCAANQTFSNVCVALNETRDRLTRDGDYPISLSSGEGIYNFGGEKATLNYEWGIMNGEELNDRVIRSLIHWRKAGCGTLVADNGRARAGHDWRTGNMSDNGGSKMCKKRVILGGELAK
jgi:hypothetical protein